MTLSGRNPQDDDSTDPQAESQSQAQPQARQPRPRMSLSRTLPNPTEYVQQMDGEYSKWAYNEERAPTFKGKWREEFGLELNHPLDLEIGTGNGYHFAHLAKAKPERALLGIELKYKPLIQSIRRARVGASGDNARIIRYDAACLDHLFATDELNNVYIHFPDPWSKERQWKHRLIQDQFLALLYQLMRPGSFVDFKTDSLDYFEWSIAKFHASSFQVERETRNLHESEWNGENFVTHYESLFARQGVLINHARLVKN